MSINILITGVGGRSVGYGILYSLRSLSPKYTIIGTDADSFSFGLYRANSGYVVPTAKSPDYISRLNNIIKNHKVEAVFPGTIPEVEKLSDNRDKIKVPLIMNLNSELIEISKDKLLVYEHLRNLGLNTPETVVPDDVNRLIKSKGFPIIIKPGVGTGASRKVTFIADERELEFIREKYEEENISYIFQEVIGTGEHEYTVGILNDKEGNLIDSIIMHRKLIGLSLNEQRIVDGKTYTISTGYSQGFIIKDKEISGYCEKAASILSNIGPLNLQLRVHNGKVYIFEVHPRFSGTTPVRASAGFNEPDILFRNFVLGEKFSRLNYQYNVAAIRAFEHVLIPDEQMKKA